LYGCSPWLAPWLDVALFAAAHPATMIATAASAVMARMQDKERFKTIPLTDIPVDSLALMPGYGARKATDPVGTTQLAIPRTSEGSGALRRFWFWALSGRIVS
jgi:hypothetical protein